MKNAPNINIDDDTAIKNLLNACMHGDLILVKNLYPNYRRIKKDDGWQAIHYASAYAQLHILKYILDNDPNAFHLTTANGYSPLDLAVYNGSKECVKILFQKNVLESYQALPKLMTYASASKNDRCSFILYMKEFQDYITPQINSMLNLVRDNDLAKSHSRESTELYLMSRLSAAFMEFNPNTLARINWDAFSIKIAEYILAGKDIDPIVQLYRQSICSTTPIPVSGSIFDSKPDATFTAKCLVELSNDENIKR